MSSANIDLDRATKLIHLYDPGEFGPVDPPIFLASTYKAKSCDDLARIFQSPDQQGAYQRLFNETRAILETGMAEVEGGFNSVGTVDGMSAVELVFNHYGHQGANIISNQAVYGPSRTILEDEKFYKKFGVQGTFIDTSNLEAIEDALKANPNTVLLYIETPANPTLVMTDLEGAVKLAHEYGVPVAVDNTFASPLLQHPFDYGVDVIVYSCTKSISGHSNVVGGLAIAREEETYRQMRPNRVNRGGMMDPFSAYQILTGVRTLDVRLERMQSNAMKAAAFLRDHPLIEWVNYPGFEEFSQYDLMRKQMDGPGNMLTFGMKGATVEESYERAKVVLDNLQLFTLAVSLGGVESLIEHPASTTHVKVPEAEREEAGITQDLVRVSVGCESYKLLEKDLEQALDKVA